MVKETVGRNAAFVFLQVYMCKKNCVLSMFMLGWSIIDVMLYSMFTIFQIRYQATSKMGSQPGDCKWTLQSSFVGLCGYI